MWTKLFWFGLLIPGIEGAWSRETDEGRSLMTVDNSPRLTAGIAVLFWDSLTGWEILVCEGHRIKVWDLKAYLRVSSGTRNKEVGHRTRSRFLMVTVK